MNDKYNKTCVQSCVKDIGIAFVAKQLLVTWINLFLSEIIYFRSQEFQFSLFMTIYHLTRTCASSHASKKYHFC